MTQEVSELLKKALALPAENRAELAKSLLESLDDTVHESAKEGSDIEIACRIAACWSSAYLAFFPW